MYMNVTCYLLYCTNDRFQQTGEISHFIKALRLRQLRVKLISRVVKESSDSLFLGERRLISLQYSEMLSISLFSLPFARNVLHRVQSCETSTKHPRRARGNFIPILKITRDELPMEQGVYGGCLPCPLYPPLANIDRTQKRAGLQLSTVFMCRKGYLSHSKIIYVVALLLGSIQNFRLRSYWFQNSKTIATLLK